jgi:cytochrome c-type biogenesis protein CcmE
MKEQLFYVAGNIDTLNDKTDFRIGGFVQIGTMDQARQYLQQKQKGSQQKLKLFQLVEMEI